MCLQLYVFENIYKYNVCTVNFTFTSNPNMSSVCTSSYAQWTSDEDEFVATQWNKYNKKSPNEDCFQKVFDKYTSKYGENRTRGAVVGRIRKLVQTGQAKQPLRRKPRKKKKKKNSRKTTRKKRSRKNISTPKQKTKEKETDSYTCDTSPPLSKKRKINCKKS